MENIREFLKTHLNLILAKQEFEAFLYALSGGQESKIKPFPERCLIMLQSIQYSLKEFEIYGIFSQSTYAIGMLINDGLYMTSNNSISSGSLSVLDPMLASSSNNNDINSTITTSMSLMKMKELRMLALFETVDEVSCLKATEETLSYGIPYANMTEFINQVFYFPLDECFDCLYTQQERSNNQDILLTISTIMSQLEQLTSLVLLDLSGQYPTTLPHHFSKCLPSTLVNCHWLTKHSNEILTSLCHQSYFDELTKFVLVFIGTINHNSTVANSTTTSNNTNNNANSNPIDDDIATEYTSEIVTYGLVVPKAPDTQLLLRQSKFLYNILKQIEEYVIHSNDDKIIHCFYTTERDKDNNGLLSNNNTANRNNMIINLRLLADLLFKVSIKSCMALCLNSIELLSTSSTNMYPSRIMTNIARVSAWNPRQYSLFESILLP